MPFQGLEAIVMIVRLRLVSVQLASCHFSIDLTGSVAQKRVKTVIDRVLQAPPPSYWTPVVHWGK